MALGQLIPAVILASAMFLLIDNFTYTIFRYGIIRTEGIWRLGYVLLLLILIAFSYRFLNDFKTLLMKSTAYRKLILVAVGIVLVSVVIAVVNYRAAGLSSVKSIKDIIAPRNRPNIIILASDGLNAANMSAYGYHRDTTPYISELADSALFCENCFTNAGTSGGSISSMFTGKLPSQTRVIYPPDILKGDDALNHLPGIMQRLGYRCFDVSIRHYADPYDLNMRNSFDLANGRKIKRSYVSERLSSSLGQESLYLLQKMQDRITNRLLHAFCVREMEDVYAEVTGTKKDEVVKLKKYRMGNRINALFTFVDAAPSPFFAHVHLLGTHGPKFHHPKRVFSKGKKQEKEWMVDFYDDAILDFDNQVKDLMNKLEKRKLLHNTVIVICTDHGQKFRVNDRLPLIFIFPDGEHKGRIKANVQNLDIAPTILDYMGMKQPDWMGGLSLLSSKIEHNRFIFTFDRKHGAEVRRGKGWELDKNKTGPPFYSLGVVGVFYCHKFYKLHLGTGILTLSDIEGHTSPCDGREIPDPEKVGQLLINHLKRNNYDTSSIKTPLTIQFLD